MNRIEEKEAYILLQCLWPKFTNNFHTGESPDLQNEIDDIGIEVTQAVEKMPQKYNKISKKVGIKKKSKQKDELTKIIFMDKDHLLDDVDNSTIENISFLCKERIKEKLYKFAHSYKHYKINGLLIFIRNCNIQKSQIISYIEYFKKENKNNINNNLKSMDYLFIITNDIFCFYDGLDNKFSFIDIDDDMKNLLYNIL